MSEHIPQTASAVIIPFRPQSTKPQHKPISQRRRFEIFKRDAFTCQYCGRKPPAVILHVDHIISVANGGSNEDHNLTTSCEECNLGKGKVSLSLAAITSIDVKERARALKERNKQVAAYEALLEEEAERLHRIAYDVSCIYNDYFTEWFLKPRALSSIKYFAKILPKTELMEAMEIACSAMDENHAFKYFLWYLLEENQRGVLAMVGFFQVPRNWDDIAIFSNDPFNRRSAWIWMIEHAVFTETTVRVGYSKEINLHRGQFVHSLRYMATAWGWDVPKVQRFMEALRKSGMIGTATDTGFTVTTLLNYNDFRVNETNGRDRSEKSPIHPISRTDDEEEKELFLKPSLKGGQKGTVLPRNFIFPEKWIVGGALEREKAQLPPINIHTEAVAFCNYWWGKSGKEALKRDWYLTWLNWCVRSRASPISAVPVHENPILARLGIRPMGPGGA